MSDTAPSGSAKRPRRKSKRKAAETPLQAVARDYWRLWLRNGRAPAPIKEMEKAEAADSADPEAEAR